ncbi:MAG: DUF3489 domain-containing protein [Bryobacteraceae bacterium]
MPCSTESEDENKMRYEVTNEGHILTIAEDLANAERTGESFGSEQELQDMAGDWPMKQLIEIWNRLPGVAAVHKFENRQIAIARIWRAMGGQSESTERTVPSRKAASKRIVFREGSKAAQVCSLLSRPEGATLNEIRSATGWQAHTVRGFISRNVAKQGRKIRSFEKNGERVYRVKA